MKRRLVMNEKKKFYRNCLPFLMVAVSFFIGCLPVNASVISYKKEADGVSCKLNKGAMKVKVCADDIIEVKYTFLDSLLSKTSLVVNALWQPPAFTVKEQGNEIVIVTRRLQVVINKATNAIRYADANGKFILSESSDNNKTMQAATIAGFVFSKC